MTWLMQAYCAKSPFTLPLSPLESHERQSPFQAKYTLQHGLLGTTTRKAHNAAALVLEDEEARGKTALEHEKLPGGHLLHLHLLLPLAIIL